MLVEATLDFPDEEIDFLQQADARGRLRAHAAARRRACWRARARARCCARASRSCSPASPTSARARCSTRWPAPSWRSSRRSPGTTRDKVSADDPDRGRAGARGRHRRPARRRPTRSSASASRAAWAEIEGADAVLFLHDLTRLGDAGYDAGEAAIAARAAAARWPPRAALLHVFNKVDAAAPRRRSHDGLALSAAHRRRASTRCARGCSNSPAGRPRPKASSSPARATSQALAARRARTWPRGGARRARRRRARAAGRGAAPGARRARRDHRRVQRRRPAGRDLRPLLHRQVTASPHGTRRSDERRASATNGRPETRRWPGCRPQRAR